MAQEEARHLRDLVQRRRQISEMITAEKNRSRGKSPQIQADIQEHIQWLEKKLKELEKQLNRDSGKFRGKRTIWGGNRSKSEGKMITVDLENNHWEEKIKQSDR